MNKRDYHLWHHMRAHGLDLRERNRILPSAREGLKHFVVKAIIGWMLNEKGLRFLTEAGVEVNDSVAYIDVFDCENCIAYEVQNVLHRRVLREKKALLNSPLVKDIIIVKLKELSTNIVTMESQLRKIVV